MTITIQSSGISLDLPTDGNINIEASNPIFSASGSMTLPLSLPVTPHNCKVLEFPNRLDVVVENNIRPLPDIPVLVTQGTWQRPGLLSLLSFSSDGIEVSVLFTESTIWSQLEGLKLSDIFKSKRFTPDGGPSRSQTYTALNDLVKKYGPPNWNSPIGDEFAVLPVAYSESEQINEVGVNSTTGVSYLAHRAENPNYLNYTVHLRLDFVLHYIMQSIGKELIIDYPSNPPFTTFDKVVIVNNTMDTITPGFIPYEVLVPDIKVKDFLLNICAQYGCALFSEKYSIVHLRFISEIFKSSPIQIDYETVLQAIEYNHNGDYDFAGQMSGLDKAKFRVLPLGQIDVAPYFVTYNIPVVDGRRQMTTTTFLDGEDTTLDAKCPFTLIALSGANADGNPTLGVPSSDDDTKPTIAQQCNKPYTDAVAKGCHMLTVNAYMTKMQIQKVCLYRPVLFANRLCLIKKIQYRLEDKNLIPVTMTLLTI